MSGLNIKTEEEIIPFDITQAKLGITVEMYSLTHK